MHGPFSIEEDASSVGHLLNVEEGPGNGIIKLISSRVSQDKAIVEGWKAAVAMQCRCQFPSLDDRPSLPLKAACDDRDARCMTFLGSITRGGGRTWNTYIPGVFLLFLIFALIHLEEDGGRAGQPCVANRRFHAAAA